MNRVSVVAGGTLEEARGDRGQGNRETVLAALGTEIGIGEVGEVGRGVFRVGRSMNKARGFHGAVRRWERQGRRGSSGSGRSWRRL